MPSLEACWEATSYMAVCIDSMIEVWSGSWMKGGMGSGRTCSAFIILSSSSLNRVSPCCLVSASLYSSLSRKMWSLESCMQSTVLAIIFYDHLRWSTMQRHALRTALVISHCMWGQGITVWMIQCIFYWKRGPVTISPAFRGHSRVIRLSQWYMWQLVC